MRRSLLLLVLAFVSCLATAQAPQAISYQAAARDLAGNALADQLVSVRFRVHKSTANGTVVYSETHSTTTSPHGLFSLSVGLGAPESGSFSAVDWKFGPYFLEVAMDTLGGSNYVLIGAQQLMSVPYALHAGSTDCFTVSSSGDTLYQGNGCYVIIPGLSAANEFSGACADADHDGYFNSPLCPPLDCNDDDATIHPGSAELCGDGVDNDCDGAVDNLTDPLQLVQWWRDADADGYGDGTITQTTCVRPAGFVANDDDCDDTDFDLNPSIVEVCSDGIDNDCDGVIDDPTVWYEDADGDGFGNPASTQMACEVPAGYIADNTDCNDQNAAVYPLAGPGMGCYSVTADDRQFITDDFDQVWAFSMSQLNGCQGLSGQAAWNCLLLTQAQFATVSSSCFQCIVERVYCSLQSCDTECVPFTGGGIRLLIGPLACIPCMAANGCNTAFAQCMGLVDQDGDGFLSTGDCNDTDPVINPDATQDVCGDAIDNDCNGTVDEGCPVCTPGQVEACGSAIGACVQGSRTCTAASLWGPCVGQVLPATEVCNSLDDDCDGQVDEGGVCGCPPAGTPCSDGSSCTVNDVEDGACNCVGGSLASAGTVCDDGNPNTTNDICNGAGLCSGTPCADNDLDGFTTCQGDCNDSNLNINPSAAEVCNGIDDNCDFQVDEGLNLGQPCGTNGIIVCDGNGGTTCQEQ